MSDKREETGWFAKTNAIIAFLASVFGIISALIVIYQFISGNTSLHIPIFIGSTSPVKFNPRVFPYTFWTWFWWAFVGAIARIILSIGESEELWDFVASLIICSDRKSVV